MTKTSLQKLEKEASGFPERARLIIVHDDKTLNNANDFLLTVKKMRKEINETFDPIKQKARQTLNEAIAQKKKFEEPLVKAENTVKLQIAGYMTEQERIRKEAEEKAWREEEERKRIEEEKLKEAEDLENHGYENSAEKVRSEIPLPKTFIPKEAPKLNGTSIREIWKWRVTDKKLVPRDFLIVNSAKITNLVRANKGQIKIPGIEVYSEKNVAARSL